MKEYIERDKLYGTESLLMSDIVEENPVAKYILEQVLFDIKETPAADVREVVHAKWERVSDWDNENNAIFDCSNCHHGDVQARGQEVPYCWYCGAKMDVK